MEILEKELKKVLVRKNFGSEENKLIRTSFIALIDKYKDNLEPLKEYIDSISQLNNFTVLSLEEVNKDNYLKNNIVKITSNKVSMQEMNNLNDMLFSKKGNNYFPDKNGEYYLQTYGYYNRHKKEIVVVKHQLDIDNVDNVESCIHEIEHNTQKGFVISADYFAGYEIMLLLIEGSAQHKALTVLHQEMLQDILYNKISYKEEVYIYRNLEIILGTDFLEQWKRDETNKDYMKDIISLFDKQDKKEDLQDIIAIIYFIFNKDKIEKYYEYLRETKDAYSKKCTSLLTDIKTIEYVYDNEILKLNRQIKEIEKELGNENFKGEVQSLKEEYNQKLLMYENILSKLQFSNNDQNKIKQVVIELWDTFDSSIDYEAEVKKEIEEYQQCLKNVELEVRNNKISSLSNLNLKKQESLEKKMKSKFELTEKYNNYQFSIAIIEKVRKLLKQLISLTPKEDAIFYENLQLELSIIFNEYINIDLSSKKDDCDSIKFINKYIEMLESSILNETWSNINKNSNIYKQNQNLRAELTNSRNNTLKIIAEKLYSKFENREEKLSYLLNIHEFKMTNQNSIFKEKMIEEKRR